MSLIVCRTSSDSVALMSASRGGTIEHIPVVGTNHNGYTPSHRETLEGRAHLERGLEENAPPPRHPPPERHPLIPVRAPLVQDLQPLKGPIDCQRGVDSLWEGIYRSSLLDVRKPQNPTKSEEHQRHLQ
eukprot:6226405-Pyramimonas_sp.AAC.1